MNPFLDQSPHCFSRHPSTRSFVSCVMSCLQASVTLKHDQHVTACDSNYTRCGNMFSEKFVSQTHSINVISGTYYIFFTTEKTNPAHIECKLGFHDFLKTFRQCFIVDESMSDGIVICISYKHAITKSVKLTRFVASSYRRHKRKKVLFLRQSLRALS